LNNDDNPTPIVTLVTDAEWLAYRFAEKQVWRSTDLFDLAHKAGISRKRLRVARDELGCPPPFCTSIQGVRWWVWMGPESDTRGQN
jgi:hypothetical protein